MPATARLEGGEGSDMLSATVSVVVQKATLVAVGARVIDDDCGGCSRRADADEGGGGGRGGRRSDDGERLKLLL